jgi:hypothetical protein
MAERHVVFALRRKYAELKGVLKFDPTADPYVTVESLRHVGCTLHMFSPAEDLTAIPPRRPYKPQRHTWARTALDILRREGRPMTARSLARRVLEAERAEATPAVLMSVECSLHAVLGRLEGRGVVRLEGEPKCWRTS